MKGNEKAEFVGKILLEYANENGINGRGIADLSPLEKWLILRLYNVVGQSEQFYCAEFSRCGYICDEGQCEKCAKAEGL